MNIYRLIGFDEATYSMNDGSQIPAYPIIFSDSLPSDLYEDITSITSWDRLYARQYQYIQARFIIGALVTAAVNPDFSNWAAGLTAPEKIIAAKWGCAPYALRMTVVSDADDLISFKVLLQQTAGVVKEKLFGRARIVEEMRQYVGLNRFRKDLISKANLDDYYANVSALTERFIKSNDPAFYNWLNSLGEYAATGYASRAYFDQNVLDALNLIYAGAY